MSLEHLMVAPLGSFLLATSIKMLTKSSETVTTVYITPLIDILTIASYNSDPMSLKGDGWDVMVHHALRAKLNCLGCST